MTAKKIIQATEPVELDVQEVTLLSKEEYKAGRKYIPLHDSWWWLRSPNESSTYYAGYVYVDGEVSCYLVGNCIGGVSPALRISNLKFSNLNPGDKLIIGGRKWTVISNELVQCDEVIGKCAFREDYEAPDANNYEVSDVKKYVERWAWEHGIIGMEVQGMDEKNHEVLSGEEIDALMEATKEGVIDAGELKQEDKIATCADELVRRCKTHGKYHNIDPALMGYSALEHVALANYERGYHDGAHDGYNQGCADNQKLNDEKEKVLQAEYTE